MDENQHTWDLHDLNIIIINPKIIQSIMEKLEPSMASGPDGILALLLKKCAKTLAIPISALWQLSHDLGDNPIRLKGALVFPKLKEGGKRSDPASWRPISHTSPISLIFERYLKDIFVNHLEKYGMIGDHQFGFRKHRSCLAQLLRFYDNVLKDLEDGSNCDIIYLDFAKLFDKVDFGRLCYRLKERWIWGKLGAWLHSFLTDCWQCMVANGEKSGISKFLVGFPKAQPWGPYYFSSLLTLLEI